jgi:cytochrome c oxidase subunit 2
MRVPAFLRLLILAVALAVSGTASAELQWNFQPPNTGLGHAVYDLHNVIMIIITVIFIGVFGFMFYAIFKHRRSVGHQAAHFHENTTVEVIWTIVPFFILIGMAWPTTKTLLEMRDASEPDLTIKATGYQWKWGYEYLDEGIKFYSVLATPRNQIEGGAPKGEHYLLEVDNPVVVPVGKKVRVLATASDVLHAWYVPALAVKQDAIPGFIRDTWFRADNTGVFRGQCAELCGKEHAYMPIVVKVVTEDEYKQWVAEQKKPAQAGGQQRQAQVPQTNVTVAATR